MAAVWAVCRQPLTSLSTGKMCRFTYHAVHVWYDDVVATLLSIHDAHGCMLGYIYIVFCMAWINAQQSSAQCQCSYRNWVIAGQCVSMYIYMLWSCFLLSLICCCSCVCSHFVFLLCAASRSSRLSESWKIIIVLRKRDVEWWWSLVYAAWMERYVVLVLSVCVFQTGEFNWFPSASPTAPTAEVGAPTPQRRQPSNCVVCRLHKSATALQNANDNIFLYVFVNLIRSS